MAGIEEGLELGVVFTGFVIVHSQAGWGVITWMLLAVLYFQMSWP